MGILFLWNQIIKILHNEDTTFLLEIEVKTYKPKANQKIQRNSLFGF